MKESATIDDAVAVCKHLHEREGVSKNDLHGLAKEYGLPMMPGAEGYNTACQTQGLQRGAIVGLGLLGLEAVAAGVAHYGFGWEPTDAMVTTGLVADAIIGGLAGIGKYERCIKHHYHSKDIDRFYRRLEEEYHQEVINYSILKGREEGHRWPIRPVAS